MIADRHDQIGELTSDGSTGMSLGTVLLIVVVLLLLGVIPTWPHSRGWGYGPSGIVGVILLVLVILVLTGRLQLRRFGPTKAKALFAQLHSSGEERSVRANASASPWPPCLRGWGHWIAKRG